MKLLINDEVFEREPEVILRLVKNGDSVELMAQKRGFAEQTIIVFESNGRVKRTKTYTDIGFAKDILGRITFREE